MTRMIVLLTLLAGAAHAAVITVNTGSDPIDIDWQTATIADLPGPDGLVSFSEAMIAADNTPGHDTVEFAIPPEAWQMQWLYPGFPVIYSSYTYFWRASESITIDGTTQTDFTGDTNPDGAELIFYGDTIYLSGDGSQLFGLHHGAVDFSGSNCLAAGNTGGIHLTFYGGSGSLVQGNECGTIKLDRSSDNVLVGNVMQRVRVLGATNLGQPAAGNIIGGPDLADRNFLTGYGYVNGEGLPAGSAIQLADATGTVIENNWIGTTVDGLAQGNLACTAGISFEGECFGTVIRGNRIAGILGHGQGPHHAGQLFGNAVQIAGSGAGITISGNTIGLDANDEPLLGSVTGIDVGTWNYAQIDGIEIADNVVAGHRFNGITVGRDVGQVRLSRNTVYANDALGIDLIPDSYGYGVTLNDPLDADVGGNGLQNFPVLAEAVTDGLELTVTGTLHSYPSSSFTVEFFASPDCDPTGHGQGRTYLGSKSVATDGAGNADFAATLGATVTVDWVVTATATREPQGATSEFGACVAVTGTVISAAPVAAATGPALGRPWPNPANPRVNVELSVPRARSVQVRIVDARGRVVKTLLDGAAPAGTRILNWDGTDGAGRAVPSGVYFIALAGATEPPQRVTLVR